MIVSYNTAIAYLAGNYVRDNIEHIDVNDNVVDMISFIYGVRDMRVVEDVMKAYQLIKECE